MLNQDTNTKCRQTAAERMCRYRLRRKNSVESGLVQGPQNQVPYVEENEDATLLFYSDFYRHRLAHDEFKNKFVENPFGHVCSVCERLWFKNDLQSASPEHEDILKIIIPHLDKENIAICNTCRQSLNKKNIPTMAIYNGFKFPKKPEYLPSLDLVSERLISPRIPFMQIRRLRHVNGQYGIYGQVINVPVCVNTMVNSLPRNIADDHCINVHIKRRKIHKSSYLHGIINKGTIKVWLQFLIASPLYTMYDIKSHSECALK